jgi:membrane protease YdiL (CAAX protease family)
VALAAAVLVWRTHLSVLASRERAVLLVVIYGAVLVASLLLPGGRSQARAPAWTVFCAGLAAVALAGFVTGHPVGLPGGAQVVLLSLLAAVAEEALFRRVAFTALTPAGPVAAVMGAAFLFALMHVPLYGVAAFPVDLGAGLLFGWQRWASGTWTVPAATHAAANLMVVMAR